MADYKWNFSRIGGITRVQIASGEDIAHLAELDKKMWTVLSCPVKGLEIDEASFKYMDMNGDGSIHIDEVIEVSKWLARVLTDCDILLKETDVLPLDMLNQNDVDGKALYEAAKGILKQLGKPEATEISLADSSSSLAAALKAKLAAAQANAGMSPQVEAPFGDKTDAVEAAYKALDVKMKDYFMRGKLSGYMQEGAASLDVQVAQIQAISADNLTSRMTEIAGYPIARVDGKTALDLTTVINPAWSAQFEVIRAALEPDAKQLTEAMWDGIGAKIKAYRDWQAGTSITEADIKLDEETAGVQLVDKLLHLTRDFYTLLKNYVTFQDFYSPDRKAIFQAGTLLIDQRTCDLCIKVSDAAAVTAQSPKSGMYLITCACTNKILGQSFNIVAAMTVGDVDDLYVGKNCIFYDRQGRYFDAKVTAITDNPISIKQALWSPYKKMANFVSEQVNKFAAEKEAGVMTDMTTGITEKTDAIKAADAAAAAGSTEKVAVSSSNFDIAKYAGIFAAAGMALGMLGSAVVAIFTGLGNIFKDLAWWQSPLAIAAIILGIMTVISGPSVFIAWTKLRKRDLAPVLNANGWAVNASAKINILFGETLTEQAKYPKWINMKDPFVKEGMPKWKKTVISVAVVLVAAGIAFAVFRYCAPSESSDTPVNVEQPSGSDGGLCGDTIQ